VCHRALDAPATVAAITASSDVVSVVREKTVT
jgi:hypothetical protein